MAAHENHPQTADLACTPAHAIGSDKQPTGRKQAQHAVASPTLGDSAIYQTDAQQMHTWTCMPPPHSHLNLSRALI